MQSQIDRKPNGNTDGIPKTRSYRHHQGKSRYQKHNLELRQACEVVPPGVEGTEQPLQVGRGSRVVIFPAVASARRTFLGIACPKGRLEQTTRVRQPFANGKHNVEDEEAVRRIGRVAAVVDVVEELFEFRCM